MIAASSDDYAAFLRALGHRVVSTGAMRWYDANRRFFMAAPPHRAYSPSEEELAQLWRAAGCVGVRFAAPLTGPGRLSYELSCSNPDYGLEGLSANTRSKVRRGLKRCQIDQVAMSVLRDEGRRAHADTVARQGRDGSLEADRWQRFFAAAAAAPGFEGWVARVDGEVAAFLVTVTFDDAVEFMLARSRNDNLGAYPNNALIFAVTEEMLVRRRVPEITFGLESLEPVEQLDQFKFSMGYEAKPIRQRIVFHPLLRPVLGLAPVRRGLCRWLEAHAERGVAWRKAAGVLRFADAAAG